MDAINRDCPIECLAALLSRQTLAALVNGIDGSPATVGQVVELYEQHRLNEIPGISTGRTGEIRRCLVEAGLIESDGRPILKQRWVRDTSVVYRHHGVS
jgi:hypothetical protein